MDDLDVYRVAYERERCSRLQAEKILIERTRTLYESNVSLQIALDELHQAQEQLIQTEKMASLGQLAAGVAHEINNPIGFSLSNLTTLKDYMESIFQLDKYVVLSLSDIGDQKVKEAYFDERKKHDIDFMVGDLKDLLNDTIKGLYRVDEIVRGLKKVAHSSVGEFGPCDINELLDASIKVVWNELKYHLQIEKDFSNIPIVQACEGELHQVFMNLFINSSHACEDNPRDRQGVLKISTSSDFFDECEAVRIEVRDNGKGMNKEVEKKIFDPFFSTKPVGVGTGLGLSISFGIVERHGGKIFVASEEGKGACFTILLPVRVPAG